LAAKDTLGDGSARSSRKIQLTTTWVVIEGG
jgi:hypothetical protein